MLAGSGSLKQQGSCPSLFKMNKKIKEERERIKKIIREKIEAINVICERNKSKRGKHSIGRSRAIKMLENIIFYIDNPDYIRLEDREISPY